MTTDEKTTQNSGTRESACNCGEMMKMMSRCMEGKGEAIDFERFCGKMSGFCRDMMKSMENNNNKKGE